MIYTEIYNTEAKLSLITRKAKEDKRLKFISLIHLLNDKEYLFKCFKELQNGKSAGIDNRTKESYTDQEIKESIDDLIARMRNYKYRPMPVKRVYIPKDNGKQRPLGIPTTLDKTIQLAVKRIIEPIFEPLFLEASYGYRPNRDAHKALDNVSKTITTEKVNWIIDADIKSFFDNVNHEWMITCLKQRITDKRLLILINRMLKSGIMQERKYIKSNQGTPQGGIISPLLANIYLHYVLDLWFNKVIKPNLKGYAEIIRYADDFIICCQYKNEAEYILRSTKERLNKFSLRLAEDKTKIIEFGRFAQENRKKRNQDKPETFNFLGFTHYCSKTRNNKFTVKQKTSYKRFKKAVRNIKETLKISRTERIEIIWEKLSLKLRGHYQYYGIRHNYRMIQNYYHRTRLLIFKWLNRRSQRRTWNWEQLSEYLKLYPLPKPKIMYNPFLANYVYRRAV